MMRVFLLLLGCSAADAHGRLTVPRPRPPLWAEPGMQGHTSATATYRWNEPVFTLDGPMSHNGHAYRVDSYRCHDFKAETPQTIITAGASLAGSRVDPRCDSSGRLVHASDHSGARQHTPTT